jgi:hypothetical protein
MGFGAMVGSGGLVVGKDGGDERESGGGRGDRREAVSRNCEDHRT